MYEVYDKIMERVARLTSALWRHSDADGLRRMAYVLDYMPDQLKSDIDALDELVQAIREGEDTQK